MTPPPLSSVYDLSRLSEAGEEIVIAATPEQRARLAEWAGLDSVSSFEARVTLRRRSANRFDYQAVLSADIVQSCVVTLEPVPAQLAVDIARELHLSKFRAGAKIAPHDVAPSEDGPEEIDDSHYDLAAPLLEDFVLAIEPYPRAPGVVFEAPPDEDAHESPFAALKSLANRQ